MTSLEIRETINDPESDFAVKRFRIGNLSIEGPVKTVDAKNVTRWMFEKEKPAFDTAILETAKTIKPESVDSLLKETEDRKIRDRFGFAQWFSNYPNMLTYTFDFSPYDVYGDLDTISGFFDYYHTYSDTAVFVPNIRVQKRMYGEVNGRTKLIQTIQRMTLKDYRRYVEEAYEILNFRNKKPIFVPIPLEFGMEGVKDLAEYYIKKGFHNAWADFQSSPITDRTKLALIRQFQRIFEGHKRLDDLVIHSTNIRREIILHSREELSPSSDILAPVIGTDLVGVNRNPPAPQERGDEPLSKEERLELWRHKARVFDSSSYYYVKAHMSSYDQEKIDELMNKKYNILFNSRLLNEELNVQKERFLDELSIRPYISNKPMVDTYRDGELKGILFEGGKKVTDLF